MKNIEAQFIADIVANPSDDAVRAIYADWLEDNGRVRQSTFLRKGLKQPNRTQAYSYSINGKWGLRVGRSAGKMGDWLFRHVPIPDLVPDYNDKLRRPYSWEIIATASVTRGMVYGVGLPGHIWVKCANGVPPSQENVVKTLFTYQPVRSASIIGISPARQLVREFGWILSVPKASPGANPSSATEVSEAYALHNARLPSTIFNLLGGPYSTIESRYIEGPTLAKSYETSQAANKDLSRVLVNLGRNLANLKELS